jgi:hypothetical protein
MRPMNIWRRIQSVLFLGLLAACVDIQGPAMEQLPPSDILAEVRIRSNAIMIEEGDSLQVEFDLIAMNNDRIPLDPNNIKWESRESQIVSVSPTGMIYGRSVSSAPVFVIVEYVHKYVTKRDTVSVYVTDGRIDANGIKLVALDSNRIGGIGFNGAPRVRIDLYKDGTLVQKGALIPIQIDPPAKATADAMGGPDNEPVYRITNQDLLIGKFWIRSSLNLYGNEVNDSILFTGLYSDFVLPAITALTVAPNSGLPVPLLDTVPINTYQVCAINLILNLSMETVDVIFSDSTASPTGCAPGDPAILSAIGLPAYGDFIGGNVLSLPPFMGAIRRSNTTGVIVFRIRKSSTKEELPWFAGHFEQKDVQP